MTDTLQGVIVGGLIAAGTAAIPLFFEYRKWKKERRIEHLRIKKKERESLFAKTQKEILDGIAKDAYSMDMLSDIEYLLPQEIFDKFKQIILDKNANKKIKDYYFDICRLMKKSLSEIDSEIEEELK